MNYMKDVAALLGVELNEEFKITYDEGEFFDGTFKITDEGLYKAIDNYECDLRALLAGYWQIQRLPFKPKLNETYWTLDYTPENEIKAVEYAWKYWTYDYLAYYNGLCFRTEQEALANKDKLLKIINHYEEN